AYTFGLFRNDDASTVSSYLRDSAGQLAYAGTFNVANRAYNIAASAFSNSVYQLDELQLAQGLSIGSATGGAFDFEVVGSAFDTLKSHQGIPSAALPGAFSGGPGATTNLDGTSWYTLDGKLIWRPSAANDVSIGVHEDRFKLKNPRYALANWTDSADEG